MGAMAGLVALGATLLIGMVFVGAGGALAAAVLQRLPRRGAPGLPFRPLWRVAALAFLVGLLLGNGLTWLWGGPSPVTTLIGLPLYLVFFSWLLRQRFPLAYATRGWWHTLSQVFLATLGSCITVFGALLGLRMVLG